MKVLLILSIFLSTFSYAEDGFNFDSFQTVYLVNSGNNPKSSFYNGSRGLGFRYLDLKSFGIFGTFHSVGVDLVQMNTSDDFRPKLDQYRLSGVYLSLWYHLFGFSLFEGEYFSFNPYSFGALRFSLGPHLSIGTGSKSHVESIDESVDLSEEENINILSSGLSANIEFTMKLKYVEFSIGIRKQYLLIDSVSKRSNIDEVLMTVGYNEYELNN